MYWNRYHWFLPDGPSGLEPGVHLISPDYTDSILS